MKSGTGKHFEQSYNAQAGVEVESMLIVSNTLSAQPNDKQELLPVLDAAKAVRTLPVLLGERRARHWVIAMLALQYLGCVALVMTGAAHWLLLAVLINLPVLWRLREAFSSPKPESRPEGFPEAIWPLWFSALAFDHTRKFTSLFILAQLAGHFLS